MRNHLKFLCIMLPILLGTTTLANASETTIHVVGTTTLQQFPGVQIYVCDFWDDGVPDNYMFLGIDGNYVNFYADSTPGEQLNVYNQPWHWVKASNLLNGDWWYGSWEGDSTREEAVQDTTWMIGLTPYPTKEVEVEYINPLLPIGSKWFSEGVGMMGFHFEENGYINELLILDYFIVGGYGNWPMYVGNWWRYADTHEFIAPTANITLDGEMNDWIGLDPAFQDEPGDDPSGYDGCDIRDVYVALNPSRTILYLMANFWDGAPNPIWGQMSNYAYQFHLEFSSPQSAESVGIYYQTSPYSDWQLVGNNMSVVGCSVEANQVIEIAIPMTNLNNAQQLYEYELEIGSGFNYDYAGGIRVNLIGQSGVENPEVTQIPQQIALSQNHPNPFNSQTTISYELPAPRNVQLKIYDISGGYVGTLVNGLRMAGTHEVTFDGSGLASGIYFARLEVGNYTRAQKLVLMK